ncbi:MAG: hypothetical protein LBM93_05690 [Oscillospiraceae bacterium]|nr:hypothetical protein [Oscillospiraceae bacterium]
MGYLEKFLIVVLAISFISFICVYIKALKNFKKHREEAAKFRAKLEEKREYLVIPRYISINRGNFSDKKLFEIAEGFRSIDFPCDARVEYCAEAKYEGFS